MTLEGHYRQYILVFLLLILGKNYCLKIDFELFNQILPSIKICCSPSFSMDKFWVMLVNSIELVSQWRVDFYTNKGGTVILKVYYLIQLVPQEYFPKMFFNIWRW